MEQNSGFEGRGATTGAAMQSRLFDGVLHNDDLDPLAVLPDIIPFRTDPDSLLAAYRLCEAMWRDGTDRARFASIVDHIKSTGAVAAEDAAEFKDIRARFKHLRFAHALFDKGHRYPLIFNLTTNFMGHLQDGLSNGSGSVVRRNAGWLRFMLRPRPYRQVVQGIDGFQLTDTAQFRDYADRQLAQLPRYLSMPSVSPHEFHNCRKVISRFRAYFVTMSTLYPSAEQEETARFLANINGAMGNYHDELITARLDGSLDYFRGKISFPPDIRSNLDAFLDKAKQALHPMNGLS